MLNARSEISSLSMPARTLSQRCCAALLYIYIAEIIFGGPLGFNLSGISTRKLLLGLLMVCFFTNAITTYRFRIWQLLLLTGLAYFFIWWGALIPLIRDTDISYAMAESISVFGLILIFPMMVAFRVTSVSRYLHFTNICVALVAAVVILVWILATFYDAIEFALAIKIAFQKLSGDDFGMYIGPMPDGSFRVMWITCILFPFMMLYKNSGKLDLKWSLFYLIAIYATGTRSFLYVSLLIFFILFLRYKPLTLAISSPILILTTLIYSQAFEGVRLFDVASEFETGSPRKEQLFSLLRLFADHPIAGAGFGAQADIIRSEISPYSYELTYIALLAKLGAPGFSIIVLVAALAVYLAMVKLPNRKLEIILAASSFILVTSTNPYLLNFVGISILSFMVAAIFEQGNSKR